jgi:phosphoglycerate kinase
MLNKISPSSKVLVRADLDVPITDGQVSQDYRLQRLLPTLHYLLSHKCQVFLVGHMGRPQGEDDKYSLLPVKKWLDQKLGFDTPLHVSGFSPGEWWVGGSSISMLENTRFFPAEEALDQDFAQILATGADCYVYEAFASYRPATTTHILPKLVESHTGIQFDLEVEMLSRFLHHSSTPKLLIASGAKEDKRAIIDAISPRFDQVYLGGLLGDPADLTSDTYDISPQALDRLLELIKQAKSIVFNGPLGRFEDGTHTTGTRTILQALKDSKAYTLLGGGDTLASIPALGFSYSDFDFVSTGGGAMLEFLKDGTHPVTGIIS